MAKATVKAGSGTANTTTYTYVAGATLPDVTDKTSTTGLVASIKQTGGNFTYEYDDNGNIISVVQDGKKTSYAYDALGQLIRVDDDQENATWVYTYDQGGNILSKTKHVEGKSDETTEFSYTNPNWKDQLKYVNGVELHYDNIGNLTNDGTWTYTWQNGRQLQKMQKSGETVSFVYNENGLRVQKTATSTGTTNYTLYGKNIVHMTQGSNELHFFYDAQNKPAVVVFNGTPYSYVKNLQGDIVAILDSSKKVVVSYVYDAWGRPIKKEGSLASTLGTVQPFRYRGYVFDEETELYYLRSRYYMPLCCRFICADDESVIDSTADASIENNLYAYCFNNPCNLDDVCGNWPDWLKKTVAAVAVVAVVAAVAVAVVATVGVGTAAAVVAVSAAKGAAVGLATGAVIGAGTGAISHRVRTGSWDGAGEAALNGMGDGALSGSISGTFIGAASGAFKVYKASRMWNGVPKKGISPYQDMVRHYETHVINEHQVQRARDIVNYTKDAVEFYSQHMDDLVPHNTNCWKIWGAPGGMYTDDGKILTFWYTKR